MKDPLPIIGITMGDPVGIGPEILLKALARQDVRACCRPLVLGDLRILEAAEALLGTGLTILPVLRVNEARFLPGTVEVLPLSDLDPSTLAPGKPTGESGRAMVRYIEEAADLAYAGDIAAMVTCPIHKVSMKQSGSAFHGHTELIAARTGSRDFVMMMAGSRLSVVLVTIHTALADVPAALSPDTILSTIRVTGQALKNRFGIDHPRIAVAALNPHAGEDGLFGSEEQDVIAPAVSMARAEGFDVTDPLPPDTLFYHAVDGRYDVVVCMYHDQGLIPFKMIHFKDGVNTTLGLPIIRTSVDHGTAYDIAGTGQADPGSLVAAVKLSVRQALNRKDT
ncbi:4-hydroxythreonine-4-phosphate dehydrogenase PdxA [Desulfatiferula olefinivorans]